MSDDFLISKDGDVSTITINRPNEGNRVSDEMAIELTGILTDVSRDSRLIVFRGAGDNFCLGRAVMGSRGPLPEAYDAREENDLVFNLYGAFRDAPVPVIGVIQGRATGLGCALAASCDITIAEHSSEFQAPEMSHNIMPTMLMSSLIDRMTMKGLLYLIYSTKAISAEQAMAFGIVSEVASTDFLDVVLVELLVKLKAMPVPALKAVKEYAQNAMNLDAQGAANYARNLHATLNTSSKLRG